MIRMSKDLAIGILKQKNFEAKSDLSIRPITKMNFINTDGEKDCVYDFSLIIQRGIMSDELKESLKYGQTLTSNLQKELDSYIIEYTYSNELILNSKEVSDLLNMVDLLKNKKAKSILVKEGYIKPSIKFYEF
ncbi:hypothetical protein G7L40_20280 [Paenibacillus polymyxa]|uniref:Uncharacterized protein n=1 Tax=Paenibacillus polymyxa TaxID=1406 RepID=A0A378XYZ0_PAEPO|nr:hypothetical protein [Paenibacillus polymyxa]MBE7896173.1 hypothetical protein [Paenibacillus polymyxa]MBG9765883.1 hypothetical protein [Paenibacillus polymyxa]MCC3256703.1 hypothetical protein [Paenibacillus polymyxa]QPK54809.1 hypothetical protein G7035_20320 [Paenibacillus polymyxa]QPK59900.1 hypothetical protein G7L40_20280 [Paenibacillus polymyxa]